MKSLSYLFQYSKGKSNGTGEKSTAKTILNWTSLLASEEKRPGTETRTGYTVTLLNEKNKTKITSCPAWKGPLQSHICCFHKDWGYMYACTHTHLEVHGKWGDCCKPLSRGFLSNSSESSTQTSKADNGAQHNLQRDDFHTARRKRHPSAATGVLPAFLPSPHTHLHRIFLAT